MYQKNFRLTELNYYSHIWSDGFGNFCPAPGRQRHERTCQNRNTIFLRLD
jgi:hypothetical protein